MDIVFDPQKNQVNLAKHGISLLEAESLEWETAVVVFVDQGVTRRIISLRKTNQREVARYAET
ncbi:BrnT family toxin [Pusillimonas sp. MFBS29]|uniref:BrnT family toxin n=1 Tax=Pusillimonas sp. MFBS29 TaxID=2886690 RepID=UPI001D12586E|nr:BrnT family toxin [Pusillimonas sp. MFBS29]MCC2595040.1 BrnT family toxin [Pusillimonas sp. MFBS29]